MAHGSRWARLMGLSFIVALVFFVSTVECHHRKKAHEKPAPALTSAPIALPTPAPEFTNEEIDNGTALAKLGQRALENARNTNRQQTHLGANNPCQGKGVLMRKEW